MSHRHGIKTYQLLPKQVGFCGVLLVGFSLEIKQAFTQACAHLSWHWPCGS